MEFSNKTNEEINLPDGRTVWLSRSVAVVCQVWSIVNDYIEILAVKRGVGCPDEVGKYCLPCGYLDWDEHAGDACKREIWEESGLDLNKFFEKSSKISLNPYIFDYRNPPPWKVVTNPNDDAKQNVCLHYSFVSVFEKESDIPPFEKSTGGEENEIDDICWLSIDQILENKIKMAFNHNKVVEEFSSRMTEIMKSIGGY